MGLLRYQLFLVIGAAFVATWAGLLKRSSFDDKASIRSLSILYAPLWAILLLGIYAVGSIGYGLLNFKDVPEAAAEIDRQIVEAKAEMTKRGVIKTKE
jgi:hypothetical protein